MSRATRPLVAGIPVQSAGVTVSRFCASGLEAIAHAARRVVMDGVPVAVGGGVESISLVQPVVRRELTQNDWLMAHKPSIYTSMIETADIVAERYGVSRERQDAFSLESQRRTAAAQQCQLFADEIVPMSATMLVTDKATGETREEAVTLSKDEGNRPDTTLEGLLKLKPVRGEDKFVTAGNASQLSDGASASVVMSAQEAARRGLSPLGIFRGFASAGCEPDEMGIGPVFAVPRLLERNGLKVSDIDLWELNEAFASQSLYCRDTLGIDPEKVNVNGGAIAIGHPFGMSGARLVGPCAAGRPPPQGALCGGDDVRRGRHGLRRAVRDQSGIIAMDLRFTAEELAFRDEVRQFFRTEIPAEIRRRSRKGAG